MQYDNSTENQENIVNFPISKVGNNLSNQIDQSSLIFSVVKKIGIALQQEKLSDNGQASIESIMKELLEIGQSLSDEAYETGKAVDKFILDKH